MPTHPIAAVLSAGAALALVLVLAAAASPPLPHMGAGGRAAASGGAWKKAEEVPGTAALNTGGAAEVRSVSCASAGNCSAGGFYANVPGHQQAFVIDEVHGTWGTAEEVPGTAALNRGGHAVVASLSCASADNCSAGGYYFHTNSVQQTFIVNKG